MRARELTAAVFDVEGTLVDCVGATLESWRQTLVEAGFAFSLKELQPFSGMDGGWMLEQLLPTETPDLHRALLKQQGERYRWEFIHQTHPFRGVNALFRRLKDEQVRIGIATTCQPDELAIYDQQLRILELVDAVACGEMVKHGKPDPGLFRLCLKRLKQPPQSAVAIGDTPFDAIAAKHLGMHSVGVLTGGFSTLSLHTAGHDQVFPEITQVVRLWQLPHVIYS